NGFNTVENGGNVTVVAAKPADIIILFLKKEIDGAWVPEPLGAILKEQGNGFILVDERDLWPPEGRFVTANILARTDYLRDNPEIIKKLLEAHVDETLWISQKLSKTNDTVVDEKNIDELTVAFNEGLKKITGKTYPANQLKDALSRIEFTYDPLSASLNKIASDANDLGYINLGSDRDIDLGSIYDLDLLNEVLRSKGLNPVQ
ncbi:MAG: ABC transporter substrate-binding protein, partial [Thermoproteota archaeon]|nr:ABC transporter substrate-binding protein [Thermoproteota archaeon]